LDFILFDQYNVEPILKKAKEFQQKVSNCHDDDLDNIERLIADLQNLKSTEQFKKELEFLFRALESWPNG
jgi:hypothetical protein